MFELIEKLRQKPENTKKTIAFLGAFIFTGIIFGFWAVSVYPSFKEENSIKEKEARLTAGPISSFSSFFSVSISQIKDQVSNLKEIGSSFKNEVDYYKASSTNAITSTTTPFSEN